MKLRRVVALGCALLTATTCLAADERPASRTIDLLSAEAAAFFMAASVEDDPHRRGRLLFLSDLALDRIRGVAAGGPEAAEMTFGRFRSLDVGLIDRSAKAWEAANRAEAEKMRTAERALAERLIGGAAASVAAGPVIPSFGAAAPSAPSPVVPSFGAGAPTAPTAQSSAPTSIEPGSQLSRAALIENLKNAVVIIFVADQPASGTGFFISPRHIVTNSHVAAGADRFVVASKTIGIRAAKIVARGQTDQSVGIDAAVLETDGWTSPFHLPFAAGVSEGTDIAIAGFPAQASEEKDRAYDYFFALVENSRLPTVDQIPTPKFDFGYVQSVFTDTRSGLLNIQEGLNTGKGNSGSPVVNGCGEVVGLHYKGDPPKVISVGGAARVDGSKFNYAVAGVEVLKFIRSVGAPVTTNSGVCTPR